MDGGYVRFAGGEATTTVVAALVAVEFPVAFDAVTLTRIRFRRRSRSVRAGSSWRRRSPCRLHRTCRSAATGTHGRSGYPTTCRSWRRGLRPAAAYRRWMGRAVFAGAVMPVERGVSRLRREASTELAELLACGMRCRAEAKTWRRGGARVHEHRAVGVRAAQADPDCEAAAGRRPEVGRPLRAPRVAALVLVEDASCPAVPKKEEGGADVAHRLRVARRPVGHPEEVAPHALGDGDQIRPARPIVIPGGTVATELRDVRRVLDEVLVVKPTE